MERKPKIIFLYTHSGFAPGIEGHDIYTYPTNNKFIAGAMSDGFIYMLDQLAVQGYVESVRVFVDARTDFGNRELSFHTKGYCVPNMMCCLGFIRPGDILIIRGGFKPWIPFIQAIKERGGNQLVFYAANTSNTRWPFWDIVLDDLSDSAKIQNDKLFFLFNKPVNEGVFYPDPAQKKIYDVCIGASHIHRKKGQFRVVEAAVEYEKLTGKRLKMIMPGGFIRCAQNATILSLAKSGKVELTLPGAVSRHILNEFYNQSRLFVHAGAGGQNDRSLLEALRCGIPSIIANPKRFPPWVRVPSRALFLLEDNEPDTIAEAIHAMLLCSDTEDTENTSSHYQWVNGLQEVCIPRMLNLMKIIREREATHV